MAKIINNIPKIGIFGWTKTGKTTYISMFQYLISYHYHPYIKNSFIDNNQIRENIHVFLEKGITWNDIPSRIGGTETFSNIRFKVHTEDGFQEFDIGDYRGEDITIKKEKSIIQDEIHEYFLGCDAVLFFLDANMFEEENELSNRKRWEEFQEILEKLSQKNNQTITIPFYLVVTKADVLGLKNDYEDIEDFIKDRYFEIYKLLKNFGSGEPFLTSSKVCFEEYVQSKNNNYEESVKFSAPILSSLGDILEKREEKKRKKRTMKMTLWLAKIAVVVVATLIVAIWGYKILDIKYNNEISELIEENNVSALKDYKRKNTLLSFFPSLKEKLNRPILKTEENDFNEILETAKDYTNYRVTVKLINEFKQNFPNSSSRIDNLNALYNKIGNRLVSKIKDKKSKDYTKKLEIIESLRKHLTKFRDSDELDEWKKEFREKLDKQIARQKDSDAYKKIWDSREDYESVLLYSSAYLKNFQDGLKYKKVQKISKDAEIVKKIHKTSESDYDTILDLCQKHRNLKTGYFKSRRVTQTPCANAKGAQKRYKKEMKALGLEDPLMY